MIPSGEILRAFFHLGQDSPLVGFFGIPVEILFPVADLSGGNDSNPAFLCNGALPGRPRLIPTPIPPWIREIS